MKKYTWFIANTLCILVMSSCHFFESTEAAGGPCSYKDTQLVARVIAVNSYDSTHFDVWFKLDSNALIPAPHDTILYSLQTSNYLDKSAVDSLGIQPGKAYTYLVREIIEGHCNPRITRIIFQKPN
jgi:hypothetical protein